jgi:hypothetical protein
MAIYYPPIFINNYLAEKVPAQIPNRFASSFKFFPTSPTDIDALTQGFPESSTDVFAVYDRMFRMRRTAFPHIKGEQLLYYFYKMASDPEGLIETTQVVQDLLDNGDESAQDINSWIAQQPRGADVVVDGKTLNTVRFGSGSGSRDFLMPYFHEIKVWQLEETRDIIDFGTARTFAGNKVIIDYTWHKS